GTPACLIEEAMARQLGALGVHAEQTVILYDSRNTTALAYSFWALEQVGQHDVRILDGGFEAWQAADAPSTDELPRPCRSDYDSSPRACRADAAWIAAHPAALQLVDARGVQEWRAAHIPGAINCNWVGLTCGDGDTSLLPVETIQSKLDALGLSPDKETVTYCRSGPRASFVYLVLRLLNWPRLRTYDGSMTDWLLHERPVAR
ncbi:MAG: sulfurtransferase, partial [Ardenticatenaceae bacterium]